MKKDIWTEGIYMKDDKGKDVFISVDMLQDIYKQIMINNGRNIYECLAENVRELTDEQYYNIAAELEDIQSYDSGDDEYAAIEAVLGKDWDEPVEKLYEVTLNWSTTVKAKDEEEAEELARMDFGKDYWMFDVEEVNEYDEDDI